MAQLKPSRERKGVTVAQDRRNIILETIAQLLPDPVFIFDSEGRYIDVLGGAERRLYDNGRFLIGRTMDQVLPKAIAERFLHAVHQAIASGTLQIFEYELGPEDISGGASDGPGVRQWFEGRVAPLELPDYDKPCAVWLAINVTKRKIAEHQLETIARTDSLTGILNRGAFLDTLRTEMSRVKRYAQPASLAILDIDRFKNVNDTWGHAVGDAVIIEVVRRAADGVRETDVVGRIGGEEFGILFPGVSCERAADALERIRIGIAQTPMPTEAGEVPVTVSAGVTEIIPSDKDVSEPLKRADSALYAAKNEGRNQIRRN